MSSRRYKKWKPPGFFKRLKLRVWPAEPRPGVKFTKKRYVPSKIETVDRKKYYDATSQWKASMADCRSNPDFADRLAKIYGGLKHDILLEKRMEDDWIVKDRQRKVEEAWDEGRKDVEEAKARIVSIKSITPAEAAKQLKAAGKIALPERQSPGKGRF